MTPQEIRAELASFPHDFCHSEDPEGLLRLSFVDEKQGMAIYDPAVTSCGRFAAAPADYGLTPTQVKAFQMLAEQVEDSAEATLNYLAKGVQDLVGVTTGDAAGIYFSGGEAKQHLRRMALEYLVFELEQARHEHAERDALAQSQGRQLPSAG